jgi:hypothetical protein
VTPKGIAERHFETSHQPTFKGHHQMIIDSQNEFSVAQAVTSTVISSNVIDLFASTGGGQNISSNARIDIGQGGDATLVVSTRAAATDVGSDATLTVTLESADDAALSTNAQVHFSTGALPFAVFSPANTRLCAIKLPAALYRRFLGVRFTVANGPLTAGTFDAALVSDANGNAVIYRSNYRVQ